MKTRTMVNRSPCSKNKVFDSPVVENVPEIDPCYKFFLEHLREVGNSYVLDVPRGDHGSPVFIRYGEVRASDGDKAEYATKVRASSLKRSQCSENDKGPGVASDKADNVNVGHSFSQGTSSATKISEVDESYATFLSLMKIKDGHMVIEPEPGVTIVYGQAEDTPAGSDELRIVSSTSERDSLMTGLENMEEENAINTEEDGLRKINSSTSLREMVGLASENMDNQDVVCIAERGLVPYTEPPDVKVSNDSEFMWAISLNGVLFIAHLAFWTQASEGDQEEHLALSCATVIPSTFDEKLNDVLSKPYDLNEYKELLRKATGRKPVSRQRHLRNASKAYATGAVGLSYLDFYPDLSIQIDSANCDKRKLCLLRKFFFGWRTCATTGPTCHGSTSHWPAIRIIRSTPTPMERTPKLPSTLSKMKTEAAYASIARSPELTVLPSTDGLVTAKC
ncbi:hypothetical protein GUJ93_ZPchr0005g15806 [Zizania palustris]|uniref:Uncharacterized protein n=1 Tax=Zizania palustris TaxID=103762 RepID=A0A8J5S4W9_ZIZPA|nr:hypothetical protein GUJ93_ZPchr0005g15806 [Zizania palustris]